MHPTDLDHMLEVLRKHNVQSAVVPVQSGGELRVVFEPIIPTDQVGDTPTPGGWKGPEKLDAEVP